MSEVGFTDSTGKWRKTTIHHKPVPLGSWRAAGVALSAFADGASDVPGFAVDNSEAIGIRWNNHAAPLPVFTGVSVPKDRQPNTDMKLRFLAHKSGATVGDAVTFTVAAFFQVDGALHDADATAGGASTAMVGDATAKMSQECTRTLAAADIPNATEATPACLTMSYKPTDGTLGTDDVTVVSIELEYTRIVNPD